MLTGGGQMIKHNLFFHCKNKTMNVEGKKQCSNIKRRVKE